MEENDLISAPQFFGSTDPKYFELLTEPTTAREEFIETNDGLMRRGRGGFCYTVLVKN